MISSPRSVTGTWFSSITLLHGGSILSPTPPRPGNGVSGLFFFSVTSRLLLPLLPYRHLPLSLLSVSHCVPHHPSFVPWQFEFVSHHHSLQAVPYHHFGDFSIHIDNAFNSLTSAASHTASHAQTCDLNITKTFNSFMICFKTSTSLTIPSSFPRFLQVAPWSWTPTAFWPSRVLFSFPCEPFPACFCFPPESA